MTEQDGMDKGICFDSGTIGPDLEIERFGRLFEMRKPRITFQAFVDQCQDRRSFLDWAKTDRLIAKCRWSKEAR